MTTYQDSLQNCHLMCNGNDHMPHKPYLEQKLKKLATGDK